MKEFYLLSKREVNADGEIITSESVIKNDVSSLYGIPPKGIGVVRESGGKPYSPNLGISYSLSHSKDLILRAYSDAVPRIGCDIQRTDRKYTEEEILKRIANEEEIKLMEKNNISFFLFWAMKEAYVKCLGKGIFDMASFSVVPILGKYVLFSTSFEGTEYFIAIYPKLNDAEIVSSLPLKAVRIGKLR